MSISRVRRSIWLSLVLVGALLWAPIWGQWHGIEHRDLQALSAPTVWHQPHGHEHALGDRTADPSGAPNADHSGHVAGSGLCQVLDHLAHTDWLSTPNTAWSAPMVPAQAPLFLAHFSPDHDRWSQPQARAPPALI